MKFKTDMSLYKRIMAFASDSELSPTPDILPYVDDLTRLPNRRFLRTALSTMIRHGDPSALLFLDLDHFKEINDSSGHVQGDRVLMKLARLLRQTLRRRDVIARYGGDEFVLVVSGGERDEGILVAEKIISMVNREMGADWGIGASIGIACCPEHGKITSDLLTMADGAMYKAKASGGSCWRLSSPRNSAVFWHEDVFMGRSRELDGIMKGLGDADSSSIVLVTGETGLGKTSLIESAALGLGEDRGILRIETGPELAAVPWAALSTAIRNRDPALKVPELASMYRNILSRLLPDVFGEPEASDRGTHRLAMLDAMSNLLQAWTPLTVIVDDLEWLDRETVSMLLYAVETGVEKGLQLLAAGSVSGQPLTDGSNIQLMKGRRSGIHLQLKPLSRFQTGELVRGRLGIVSGTESFADSTYEFSGGNPLFACEYIRSMVSSGLLKISEGILQPVRVKDPVPSRVRTIVEGKIVQLDRTSRRILQYAAVLMREPLELAILMSMSGLSQGEVLSCLDRGLKLGILRVSAEDSMSFQFTNEAYRNEVRRSAGSTLLAELHAGAAAVRLEQGDHMNAGQHLLESGKEAEAVRVLCEGADLYMKRGLAQTAVACMELADETAEHLKDLYSPEDMRELKHRLSRAYRMMGRWEEARESAIMYADLALESGQEDTALLSRIIAADCRRMTGDYSGAIEELQELRKGSEGYPRTDTLLRLADNYCRTGDYGRAEELLKEAESMIGGLGGEQLRNALDDHLHQRLILSMSREDFVLSEGLARELAGLSLKDMQRPWWYFYDAAEALLLAGRPVQAMGVFRQGLARAEAQGSVLGSLALKAEAADALFHTLDPAGSRKLAGEVRAQAAKLGQVTMAEDMRLLEARLIIESGNLEQAGSLMDELVTRRPDSPSVAAINSLFLEMKGDIEGSLSEVRRVLEMLNGRNMTSMIDSSVLLTTGELKLQEAWTDTLISDEDWPSVFQKIRPELGPRASFRGMGLTARWLFERGMRQEADGIIDQALSTEDYREMLLQRYRCLIIKSGWNIDAAEEAWDLKENRREEEQP